MKKILISDSIDKKCESILKSEGFAVDYKPGISENELKKIINQYSCLIVRSSTQITSELISLMNEMEIIGRAGTGVDNIDVDAATRKGILVMNTPGGNTISAAEHTIALIMAMLRNIPQANNSLKEGNWDRKKYKGSELFGKTLGVIGLGKIGREVSIRLKSFGMDVIGYDPLLSDEIAHYLEINLVDLENLFASSDIITIHVPLNESTKNLISKENLSKCKDGVKIVNCARGGIVNENDIVNALEIGKVSAAAFDVYTDEPPNFKGKLIQHPKIVCTPHLGASTEEAQEKVAVQIAEQIAEYLNGKETHGIINAPSLKAANDNEIIPYMMLAENIGALHSQLQKGSLKQININYSGEFLHNAAQILNASLFKGFLLKQVNEPVNLINAPVLIKEKGIKVNETKTGDHFNYTNLITVDFITTTGKKSLSGTIFGTNEIRVVKVDDYFLEFKPEGNLLIYSNLDKPGVLANVGKLLSEENVNIAGLSLGRIEEGKEALTVINLDQAISQKIIERIKLLPDVRNVTCVVI